eukprot:TRINITY_DN2626_c0_g1_i1.p1 TRINITY_DN2626_c0_g1~~TRINITY_DN2626_c0_g1_i1.p1  ORF type:complete len:470 (-),score=85.26 TRINITY_DN2626_c0_g1_i1:74-1438(-)
MSYRSREYYCCYSLRYSSTVTRKETQSCPLDSRKKGSHPTVAQRVGELQERTEQVQKELAQLNEQFQEEQLRAKLKRAELEERVKKEREEDRRRVAERKKRQQERRLQQWEEYERERQRLSQQRRAGRQAQLQAAEERALGQQRRRRTPPTLNPSLVGLASGGRRSPRDTSYSPREHRSPREGGASTTSNIRRPERNSPRGSTPPREPIYISRLEEVREDTTEDSDEERQNSEVWMNPTLEELSRDPTQYCPILCRETQDYVSTLCGHYFDREAFTTWMSQPNSPESCPVCRKPFKVLDKKAQRKLAHQLVVSYLNHVSGMYRKLWESDRNTILAKFWESINDSALNELITSYKSNSGVNISQELQKLIAQPVEAYTVRLKQAMHDLIIKDIRINLKNHVPVCYQNQLDKEKTIYFAYSLTQLVPDYHIKWWKSTYLPLVYSVMEELFLKRLDS